MAARKTSASPASATAARKRPAPRICKRPKAAAVPKAEDRDPKAVTPRAVVPKAVAPKAVAPNKMRRQKLY